MRGRLRRVLAVVQVDAGYRRWMDGGTKAVSRVGWVAGLLLVTVVAGALRLWMPGPTIVTTDEMNWQRRSAAFASAFENRDFGAMVSAESGKSATRPGVTTMWTGYAAQRLADSGVPGLSGSDTLRTGHRLMAIWCTLLLIPFMVISARLIGRRGALVAGGVVAVEPLAVGHSALLHTDALMTMALGVAIVALLATFDETRRVLGSSHVVRVGWWRRPVTRLGGAVGVAAALALLTKVSALVLIVGAAAASLIVHAWLLRRSGRSMTDLGRSLVPPLLVPTGLALATIVIVWPAMWVDPVGNISSTIDGLRLADKPSPRLLLGEVIEGADWRYYPVEMAFRVSAWLAVAVPISIGWFVLRGSSGRPPVLSRRNSMVLLAAGVLYTVAIVTSEKQYGRYLLPLLPLAAVGIGAVGEDVVRALRHRYHLQRRHMPRFLMPALGTAALVLTAAWTASLAPFQISHVNALAGGQSVAEHNIQLGWGEGREVVLENYHAQSRCDPWAGEGGWLTPCRDARQDFSFLDGTEAPPRYVFRYVFQRQLGREPEGLEAYLRSDGQLISAVTIDGVHYAELWRIGDDDDDV